MLKIPEFPAFVKPSCIKSGCYFVEKYMKSVCLFAEKYMKSGCCFPKKCIKSGVVQTVLPQPRPDVSF